MMPLCAAPVWAFFAGAMAEDVDARYAPQARRRRQRACGAMPVAPCRFSACTWATARTRAVYCAAFTKPGPPGWRRCTATPQSRNHGIQALQPFTCEDGTMLLKDCADDAAHGSSLKKLPC